MSKGQSSGGPNQHAPLDPRTRRAIGERMKIVPLGDGIYRVRSQSGNAYIVDLPSKKENPDGRTTATCTCRDYEGSKQGDHCKHIRRVKLDVAFDQLPRPEIPDVEIDSSSQTHATDPGAHSGAASLATDGGGVEAASNHGGANGPTPTSPPTPDITTENPQEAYAEIAARINRIEAEVDRHQGELRELESALEVLEDAREE